MEKKPIGVLGGGISALTFASLVKQAVVLEKEEQLGGLARSVSDSGYTFDLGSHIVFSKNKEVLTFMLGLLGDNKIKHRRNAKVLYNGRFVKYPFENGLGDLPKDEALQCILDYVKVFCEKPKTKPANFKEWMYSRFGVAISDKYLYPYNAKLWDFPPEKMATFWVEGRVPQPPLADVVKAAMGIESEGYLHQLEFYYPAKNGYQAIINSLATRIAPECLVRGFEIKKIKKEDGKWIVSDGNKQERSFGKMVSTIHIRDLVRAYDGVDSKVRKATDSLKWNSIHFVFIGLNNPKLNDFHWAYIPDKDILPNRVGFPSNLSENNAPLGHSSVLAEITFNPNGEKAKLSEKEIIERTLSDLHKIKILNKDDVTYSRLVTSKYAYVTYDLDYHKNISQIYAWAKNEGIILLGRFSEFKYYNADKCIESAMEKAREFSTASRVF